MWVFAKNGFLSIIEPRDERGGDNLLVRARVKGDIEHYFPEAKVIETPDADYLFRAKVPRIRVRDVMAKAIMSIDYSNFKGCVADKRREESYSSVWSNMWMMQEELVDE